MFAERTGIQLDTVVLWEGGGIPNSLAQPALPSSAPLSRSNSKASLRRLARGPTPRQKCSHTHRDLCRGFLPWVVISAHARPLLPDREAPSKESFVSQASIWHLQSSANIFEIQRLVSFNTHSPTPSTCQALRIQR